MFNPPTLEDLQQTRRANEKLVLEALDSKPEWVETELAKTTGLALSHLRAALASLLDQGRVRRLPGTGTRAVYGLADPGLADVPATPLTENAERIREYLQGRADSALYMSNELHLSREEIMAALSLLNAHNMITCTFVGSLVIFRLKEKEDLDAEKATKAAEEEAAKENKAANPTKNSPAKTSRKASSSKAASASAQAKAEEEKPASKQASKKPAKKTAAKKTASKAASKAGNAKTSTAKTAPKKATAKKTAATKTAETKTAAKPAAKKTASKKPAAKASAQAADKAADKADADSPKKPVRKRASKATSDK